MTVVDDAVKQYRVMCWLDRVRRVHNRLVTVRDLLAELDDDTDGIKCARIREDGVRISYTPDKVGELLAKREEMRAELESEAERLVTVIHDAAMVLSRAWDAHPDVADPAFAYVLAVYGEGKPPTEAARACGTTTWGAKSYPRKVAAMIYDTEPARFPETMAEKNERAPYGYWMMAKGVSK